MRVFAFAVFVLLYGLSGFVYSKEFKIFDATLYDKKPDLMIYGIYPLHIAYEPNLFAERERKKRNYMEMPDPKKIKEQSFLAKKNGNLMVVDIEQWSVHGYYKYPQNSLKNISLLVNAAHLVKSVTDLQIGFFGVLPISSGGMYEWQISDAGSLKANQLDENNKLLLELAEIVDVIFPVGYAFNNNSAEWEKMVKTQVDAARKLAPTKPVYVFLWPQYADYPPAPKEIQRHFIDSEFWKFQLSTTYKIADGVVIWGGWDDGKRMLWDSKEEWFKLLVNFVAEKQ